MMWKFSGGLKRFAVEGRSMAKDPASRLEESLMSEWIEVCDKDDIDEEDVMRFDHAGKTYAVYRSPEDTFHATDGLCTHEKVHLADGLVMDDIIECPKHNGRFNYKTGAAKGAPVCVNLQTYPVKVEGGTVFIEVS
jgi:3-phenylpropionate/trans-cinnamate dioxygenase ferredoxin subunit